LSETLKKVIHLVPWEKIKSKKQQQQQQQPQQQQQQPITLKWTEQNKEIWVTKIQWREKIFSSTNNLTSVHKILKLWFHREFYYREMFQTRVIVLKFKKCDNPVVIIT